MMKKIKIRLNPPTEVGRLFYIPNPDIEPSMIFINNSSHLKPFYFINIDSGVTIDLSKEYIIQSIEFIIHKKVWKTDENFIIPEPKLEADIQVINILKNYSLLEVPIKSITDKYNNWVFFYWGDSSPTGNWIILSNQVFGLIQQNCLTGFYIKLK